MAASNTEALQAVEAVLRGRLRRKALGRLNSRELAFVGVALMLIFADEYTQTIYEHVRVRGNLYEIMDFLVVTGIPREQSMHADIVVRASRRAGLHTSVGKGRRALRLTPPPELLALVERFGRREAALDFHSAARTARHAFKRQIERERAATEVVEARLAADAEAVIARLRRELGPELFGAVQAKLQYHRPY